MMKGPGMMLHDLALEDRYRFDGKPFYLSGTQSLVRLFQLEQRRRAEQGLNTAVYVTGYRGSPLGTLDQRSEEHTSELQSLMRSSYAVFCLKKKNHRIII